MALASNELRVLLAVTANQGQTVSAPRIADVIDMSRFAVDRALAKLTADGFVSVQHLSARVYYSVTDTGRQALAALAHELAESEYANGTH